MGSCISLKVNLLLALGSRYLQPWMYPRIGQFLSPRFSSVSHLLGSAVIPV